MIVQTIRPGVRVRVVLPEGERDPWLKPKAGWEGIVLAPARDVAPDVWRVVFEPPYCCLGIPRVMPAYALTVIDPLPVEKGQSQLRLPMGQEAS